MQYVKVGMWTALEWENNIIITSAMGWYSDWSILYAWAAHKSTI